MHYQESARRLEDISDQLVGTTEAFTQIFRDLKLTRDISIPEHSPSSDKFAASAVIAELETAMRTAAEAPDNVEVAVQLAKLGDKLRICFPGGAMLSQEELAWIETAGLEAKDAPANLFYQLAQEQLLSSGKLKFSYELSEASFGPVLRKNLRRELGEELGSVAEHVQLRSFFDQARETTLATISLPDKAIAAQIAGALAEQGVSIDEKGVLSGVYTTVREKVALADGPIGLIEKQATDNVEAAGIRVKTLAELLELAKRTTESVEAYKNFRQYHTDSHNSDGIRNPSTTWALGLFVDWLRQRVIAQDPYRQGTPVNPFESN